MKFQTFHLNMNENSTCILRNQKIIIGLVYFLTNVEYIWSHLDFSSVCINYAVERFKITKILFGSMLPTL